MNRNEVIRKDWNALSSEEKNLVINTFLKTAGLTDFDYDKAVDFKERMEKENPNTAACHWINSNEPAIITRVVDPVLTDFIMKWMFATIQVVKNDKVIWNNTVPFAGLEVIEFGFERDKLGRLTEDEREIICHAIEILKTKNII